MLPPVAPRVYRIYQGTCGDQEGISGLQFRYVFCNVSFYHVQRDVCKRRPNDIVEILCQLDIASLF